MRAGPGTRSVIKNDVMHQFRGAARFAGKVRSQSKKSSSVLEPQIPAKSEQASKEPSLPSRAGEGLTPRAPGARAALAPGRALAGGGGARPPPGGHPGRAGAPRALAAA